MLGKLYRTPSLQHLLPFVRMFYGKQSTYLWTDDAGSTHRVLQGEGGEQGDPLMPALYSLGQHDGLAAGAAQLHEDDFVVAFLDDLYVKTTRERADAAFAAEAGSVHRHAGVQTIDGKLRAWSRAGGGAPPGLGARGNHVWTGCREGREAGI